MSSNIVEFPVADRPITEGEISELHAKAFRDLEPRICDCVSMAKIAAQEAMSGYSGDNRELVFAIAHAFEMLEELKTHYYAAWHGENQKGPS
jgi:hypothetical protein